MINVLNHVIKDHITLKVTVFLHKPFNFTSQYYTVTLTFVETSALRNQNLFSTLPFLKVIISLVTYDFPVGLLLIIHNLLILNIFQIPQQLSANHSFSLLSENSEKSENPQSLTSE